MIISFVSFSQLSRMFAVRGERFFGVVVEGGIWVDLDRFGGLLESEAAFLRA